MVRSEAAMSYQDGNWIKFLSALRQMAEGIEPFVTEVTEECTEEIIGDARKAAGLHGKEVCGQCTTHNVLRCSSRNGLCNYDEMRNCTYHDRNDPLKESKPCPQGICDKIANIISKYHRFHRPNFKNTDARKWFENSWEIIKCFIPTNGYENRTNAEDTDATGLLAIVTNCKRFESRVAANLGSSDNPFFKIKEGRNDAFHSPGYKISDRDLHLYIQLMLDVLEDQKHLAHDSEAQKAAIKIREIAESSVHVFCGEEIPEQTAESNESEEKHTSTDQEHETYILRRYGNNFSPPAKERSRYVEAAFEAVRTFSFIERDSDDRRTIFEQLHTKKTDQQTDSSQGSATSAIKTSRRKPAIVIVFAKKRTSEVKTTDPISCKPSNTTSRQMTNQRIGDDCKGGGGGTVSGTNDPQRSTIKC